MEKLEWDNYELKLIKEINKLNFGMEKLEWDIRYKLKLVKEINKLNFGMEKLEWDKI